MSLASWRLTLAVVVISALVKIGASKPKKVVSADEAYRDAAAAYNKGNFRQALKHFTKALQVMPADSPLKSSLEALVAQTREKIKSSGRSNDGSTSKNSAAESSSSHLKAMPFRRHCTRDQILQPSDVLVAGDPTFDSASNPFLARVYVTPVLSASECDWIIGLAEKAQDWKSRLNYETSEVSLEQIPELQKWASKPGGFFEQTFALMCHQFGLTKSVELQLENSNVIRYESSSNVTNHVLIHSDGSTMVTFNVLLSSPADFDGGGTGMLHLGRTIFPEQGSMVTYYSNAYHSGEPVTRGKRYIWQGFLGVHGENALPHQDEMHLLFARKALSVQPNLLDANYNAGNLLRTFGRFEESAGCLKRALDQGHPMPHFVLAQLADTQKELGKFAEAKKSIERALMLAPHDPRIVTAYENIQRSSVNKKRRQERKHDL